MNWLYEKIGNSEIVGLLILIGGILGMIFIVGGGNFIAGIDFLAGGIEGFKNIYFSVK